MGKLTDAVTATIAAPTATKTSLWERFGEVIGMLSASGDRTADRLAALQQRIEALENGQLQYVGVHQEGRAYKAGGCCTYGGSLWIERAATSARPGSPGSNWQLAAKRGDYR